MANQPAYDTVLARCERRYSKLENTHIIYTWIAELVPLSATLFSFIYGLNKFFKKGKPLFLQSITMAMGSHALGSIYRVCQKLTTETEIEGFTPAYVLRGEIPMSRIDDACQRVLDLKEKIGLFRDDYELAPGELNEINAAMSDFNQRAAKKAISLVCDKNKIFPLNPEKIKKVCIIYSGHDKEGEGKALDNMTTMIKAFEARGAEVFFRRGLLNGYASQAELKEISEKYDLIVYAGYLMRWIPRGMSSFYGDEISTFQNALRYGAEKSVGIGLGVPYVYYDFYSAFPAYINTYNYFPELQEAAVAAMYGEIDFEGGEPFKLIPKYVEERLAMLKKLQEDV